jgi:hypothetical protein
LNIDNKTEIFPATLSEAVARVGVGGGDVEISSIFFSFVLLNAVSASSRQQLLVAIAEVEAKLRGIPSC